MPAIVSRRYCCETDVARHTATVPGTSNILRTYLRVLDDKAGAEEKLVLRGMPHHLMPGLDRLLLRLGAAA